jgi:hypothetical protein
MQMPKTHQMLLVNGKPQFCERPNYLKNAMFKGQYDANPMYARHPERPTYSRDEQGV